jgi:hypothetical protein
LSEHEAQVASRERSNDRGIAPALATIFAGYWRSKISDVFADLLALEWSGMAYCCGIWDKTKVVASYKYEAQTRKKEPAILLPADRGFSGSDGVRTPTCYCFSPHTVDLRSFILLLIPNIKSSPSSHQEAA